MSVEKTVYILGAGASAPAHIPIQAGILERIFSINRQSFSYQERATIFLDMEINDHIQKLQEKYSCFNSCRSRLGNFIVKNFASADKASRYYLAIKESDKIEENSEERIAKKEEYEKDAYEIVKSIKVSLEDLFTIFDSTVNEREQFRMYSTQEMDEIHSDLKKCIIYALSFCIENDCDNSVYSRFANFLVKQRLEAAKEDDNLAVITMNWDNILEQTIYHFCEEYNNQKTKNRVKIYPDLCFYDYDYRKSQKHIPSTQVKARGNKNIKILKMHGSLAWLECPKCGRILTDYKNEIACEELNKAECPYCKCDDSKNPLLRNLIITPTFLKSLDNLNVKNIWHNAYIEIYEAKHIVFIGYSLPDADFEMRCLLKKAVKNSSDIKVVLDEYSNPEYYSNILKDCELSEDETQRIISKMALPHNRYVSFFGEDKVSFIYDGFEKYLDDLGV